MRTVWILGSRGVIHRWPTYGEPWSMNALHLYLQEGGIKPEAWFQLHRREDLFLETPQHLDWLKEKHDFPVYMHEHYDEFPSSVRFPVDDVVKLWPFRCAPIFSSSFSWMIAFAILEKVDKIMIRGMFLETQRENMLEAPNSMLWAGIAAGKGIDVDIDGRLMSPCLYGYEARRIPFWVPQEVANDIIVDSTLEGRKLQGLWAINRNMTDNPMGSISREDMPE